LYFQQHFKIQLFPQSRTITANQT